MSDKMKVVLKWGVIGGIASAIVGLVLFLANIDSSSYLNYLSFAILIAMVIMGGYEYRDKILGGFASFKSLLGFSMLIVLVYAVFSSAWAIFYMEVIDPQLVDEILLQTEIRMEEQGLDDEAIQQALTVTKKMMKPYIFFFTSLLSTMFFGLLISLLTSMVLRKDKPEDLIIDEMQSE